MKLYSTITSEKSSRPAKKGGDERLTIGLNKGNRNVATIDFDGDSIRIWYNGDHHWRAELN